MSRKCFWPLRENSAGHELVPQLDRISAVVHMAYARECELVVLTQDLDFGAILAATRGRSPSVIQIRADDLSPAGIGPRIVQVIRLHAVQLESGALITVDPARTRISILPLSSD